MLKGTHVGDKMPTIEDLSSSEIVGTWNLSIETDEEELDPILVITEKNGNYVGVFDGHDVGKFPVEEIEVKGNRLTFGFSGEMEGQEFEAACRLRIKDKKLRGRLFMEIGGEEMEFQVAGTLKE